MAKVLHVVESLEAGGAERVVSEYARTHDPARYRPQVACVLYRGPFADAVEAAGVPVHVLGRKSRTDLRPMLRLARLVAKERFDVVHCHNFTALSVGLPAAILGRARVVIRTEHNVCQDYPRRRALLNRLAVMREDAQIAVSQEVWRTHTQCGRIPASRFVTVMNGIDEKRVTEGADGTRIRRELGLPDDAVVCLNVGNLTAQKNRENLMQAAALLGDVSSLRVLVVGSGSSQGSLEKRAEELGLGGKVLFLGQRLDVNDLLAASDIFVLSSDWEGLPITILEAMAAGVPCVSTEVGGVPEVLTDGVSGFLVPARNARALADRMRTLALDPALRSRMADAARETFRRRFSSELMVGQTEALYDLALAGRADLASQQRIKVLYVIGQLGLGGAERQTAELVRRIPRDRFEPIVCCLSNQGRIGDEMEDEGLRVIYLDKRGGFFSGATARLIGLIRRERPAIVHAYLFSANWRSLLAGRLMRVPLIISSVRNVDIHTKRLVEVVEWVLSGLTDRVIANAGAVKDYVSTHHFISPEKIHVIYNGVSLERAQNVGRAPDAGDDVESACRAAAGGAGCVGIIASLTQKKDHETFLRAVRIIHEEMPDVRFRLIGGGVLRAELADRARELGVGDVVELMGPRDDIGALLAELDVSVLTSLKEGCSNVVLESMAAGRPLVVTDVGGNRELIVDGETGYLVPVGDAKAVARHVMELLRDRGLRERMGEAGRERVRSRFTAQRMVDDTVGFYASVLEERARGLSEWVALSARREGTSRAGEEAGRPGGTKVEQ